MSVQPAPKESSEHLLSPEGRHGLASRDGVANVLERHPWLSNAGAGIAVGGIQAAGCALAGVPLEWSLIAWLGTALVVAAVLGAVSRLRGALVIPELVRGQDEPV